MSGLGSHTSLPYQTLQEREEAKQGSKAGRERKASRGASPARKAAGVEAALQRYSLGGEEEQKRGERAQGRERGRKAGDRRPSSTSIKLGFESLEEKCLKKQ